jgi:RimJ/RimL family protein N-acetyltransferase
VAHIDFRPLPAERVVLRRLRESDASAFAAYRSDPEVARYQSWEPPYALAKAQALVTGMNARHPDTPGEWFQFAVALRDTDQLIGDCAALVRGDDPRQVEIGFTFAKAHQGRGLATEAVRRLLDYLLIERGKHRVSASCDDRNVRSSALMRRVGMRREGLLIQSTWAKGKWTNDELFAVLRSEWQAAGEQSS